MPSTLDFKGIEESEEPLAAATVSQMNFVR